MTNDLDVRIRQIADLCGWRRLMSASALVDAWGAFVGECGTGYSMGIYEFENDRSVRGMVDRVLVDQASRATARYAEFRHEVEAADAKYRALLRTDVSVGVAGEPWWRRGAPQYGGAQLAADFAEQFEIDIEIR